MTETKELQTTPKDITPTETEQPLSAEAVKKNVLLIQDIMKTVMQDGVHYGKIPGCPKPSLFQAGAEKLNMAFRLRPSYELAIVKDSPQEGIYIVRAKCFLKSIKTGVIVGEAIAECSSTEKKYQSEKVDLNDIRNTIVAMAQKRALVRATRGATAASDIFDVDLEEDDKTSPKRRGRPPKGADAKESDAQLNIYSKGLNACNNAEELKKYWGEIQLSSDWRKLTSEDVEELGGRKDIRKRELEGRLL